MIERNSRNGGRFYCNDGWNISIVWGSGVYCSPRRDNVLFYREVEAGYPSSYEGDIMDYAEDMSKVRCTKTVYGYVPVETILEVFKKHGGVSKVTFY